MCLPNRATARVAPTDNFNIVAENDEEYQKIKAGMESVEQRITEEEYSKH